MISFRFQPKLCEGCHDLMQKTMSFIDITFASVKRNYYIINFLYMSKVEAMNLSRNVDLTEKSDTL